MTYQSNTILSRLIVLASVFVITCAATVLFMVPVKADMPVPKGPPILIVSGEITKTNVGSEAHLDRETFQSIGMKTLTTSNPFEMGTYKYEGVLLKDLLSFVGATGTQLVATALDGYAIEIPVSDVETYPVMMAMVKNGKPMTIREKGPIWIIYPIDQFEELKNEKYSSRSIWQLNKIYVR